MRTVLLATALVLPLAGLAGFAQAPARWSPAADLILTNGHVATVDRANTIADAIAVKDGRIIAVGSNADALAHRGPATKVVDLAGKTVIPGLQDSHIHFIPLGEETTREVELSYARSAGDIVKGVAILRDKQGTKPGQWIRGSRWDQFKYPQMATRWQVDEVSTGNPVRLDRTYRGTFVNTAVFGLMGIDDAKRETWPAWWLKDPADFTPEDKILRARRTITFADGHKEDLDVPTGVFLGARATRLVTARPRPYTFEEDVDSVRLGVKEMLRLGVTSIVDPSSNMGYGMKVYQEAYNRGFLQLRVASVYEGTFNTHAPERIRERLDAVKINNLGNAFLRWRGTKFYGDGGVGTRSSWLSEPFEHSDTIDGQPNLGQPVMADMATREAQYRAATELGWDLHTHSTGDQAMRQTVSLYGKLLDELKAAHPDRPRPRWSVIHAYMPIEPKTNVLPDMVKYGIIAVPNPVFNWQQGYGFQSNIGDTRMARLQPFRSYMKSGAIMASGSDYGVTTHNPWMGFYALLTRRDQTTGKVFGPDETVGIHDALRSYTYNGAFLTYDEATRGSLEVGKLADLVVVDLPGLGDLEKNPDLCFQMPDRILATLVEGQVRYQKQGFAF